MNSDDMKIDIARDKLAYETERKRERQEKEHRKHCERVKKWQDANHKQPDKELKEDDGDPVSPEQVTDDGFIPDVASISGANPKQEYYTIMIDAMKSQGYRTEK